MLKQAIEEGGFDSGDNKEDLMNEAKQEEGGKGKKDRSRIAQG